MAALTSTPTAHPGGRCPSSSQRNERLQCHVRRWQVSAHAADGSRRADISFAAGGINRLRLGRYSNYAYPANVTLLPDGGYCSPHRAPSALRVIPIRMEPCSASHASKVNRRHRCFARLDLDGDGVGLATTDALLHLRIALGVPDTAKRQASPFRPAQHATTGALSTPTCVRYARQHHRIARWILTATASIPR